MSLAGTSGFEGRVARGDYDDLRQRHRELMTEYVHVCDQLAVARANGKALGGEAFVIDHIAKNATELRRAYLRLAETISRDDAFRKWLQDAASGLEKFAETFAGVSPWKGLRSGISVTKVIVAGVTLLISILGISFISDKLKGPRKIDWTTGLEVAAVVAAFALYGLVLWMLLVEDRFLSMRNFLLGGDKDGTWLHSPKRKDEPRARRNIFELENEVFRAMSSARKAERQLDLLFWSAFWGALGVTAIGLYTAFGPRVGPEFFGHNLVRDLLFLSGLAAVALPLVRERERKWGLRPDPQLQHQPTKRTKGVPSA